MTARLARLVRFLLLLYLALALLLGPPAGLVYLAYRWQQHRAWEAEKARKDSGADWVRDRSGIWREDGQWVPGNK